MKSNLQKIEHIFCPTDLSEKSQLTLNFASGIASRLSAKITACHCFSTPWFTGDQDIRIKRTADVRQQMTDMIKGSRNGSAPAFETSILDATFDEAHAILKLAKDLDVDLIVLKARKSVFSALHYGSIVERITRGSDVPVLILPTKFLEDHPNEENLDFHEILFDYDFSEATDRLFPVAMALTKGYQANLHLLSVLEPPKAEAIETRQTDDSRDLLVNATQYKLDRLVQSESASRSVLSATVSWGKHAESVLKFVDDNEIDLICTTLSPAYFYYDKLYCAYLGQLLQSAKCPILALRSV